MRKENLRNGVTPLDFVLIDGLKCFALNKFSEMECQRGKLFERSEFFPSNGMKLNL
jgi:hypothetical protein